MNDTQDTTSATKLHETQEVLDALRDAGLTAVVHEPRAVTGRPQAPPVTQAVTILEMADADGGTNVAQFFAALAKAQGEFGDIERRMTAKIKSKREGGADYSYNYAPLDEVLAAVRPALSKNGIALMQFPQTKQHVVVVRTLLAHESGQRIWNDLAVGCTSTDAKDIGSAITYAKRYALMAMLGISPDTDDDGAGARHEHVQVQPRTKTVEPAKADGDTKSMITACRPMKRGDDTVYAIKSTTGECWTEDKSLFDVAHAAMRAERPVVLTTEMRKRGNHEYRALIEIR